MKTTILIIKTVSDFVSQGSAKIWCVCSLALFLLSLCLVHKYKNVHVTLVQYNSSYTYVLTIVYPWIKEKQTAVSGTLDSVEKYVPVGDVHRATVVAPAVPIFQYRGTQCTERLTQIITADICSQGLTMDFPSFIFYSFLPTRDYQC